MKRFWLVLLSLGLVLAFSASAMAVDVQFSGSFYAAGMYLDKTSLKDTNGSTGDNVSTAFYYQRLRVQTDFIVSPGLKLVTRFDAMERVWGAARSTADSSSLPNNDSSGTQAETENIAFDLAYVQWTSPIGVFMAGYMPDGTWGPQWGDSSAPLPKVQFVTMAGPVILAAYAGKSQEHSKTAKDSSILTTDADIDKYVAFAEYKSKNVSAGLLGAFYNIKAWKNIVDTSVSTAYAPAAVVGSNPLKVPTVVKAFAINPYASAKFGPVSIESELLYVWGNLKFENGGPGVYLSSALEDRSISMLNAYLGATVDFGMAYGGLNLAYMSGDDPGTNDKWEGGQLGGGWDWNPCLIMFNYDRYQWAGSLAGHGYTSSTGTVTTSTMDNGMGLLGPKGMDNAWFAQGFVGGRPIPALDIKASLAYATADQKPIVNWLNKTYGYEIDVTATYKITNNLSYMLGVGYLFTGDYFKGTSNENTVRNDYLLTNKLTLTF